MFRAGKKDGASSRPTVALLGRLAVPGAKFSEIIGDGVQDFDLALGDIRGGGHLHQGIVSNLVRGSFTVAPVNSPVA